MGQLPEEHPVFKFLTPLIKFSLLDFVTNAIIGNDGKNESFRDERGLARIAIAGGLAGLIAGCSLMFMFIYPPLWQLCLVTFLSIIYHFSEFLMTAWGHPQSVDYESFLFYHGFDYSVVRILYHVEYFITFFLFYNIRTHPISITVSIIGVIGALIGQAIRSIAMFQCGTSFTHQVAFKKKEEHALITHGIYAYFRHPSYFGWFLWALSIQIILFNPIFLTLSIFLAYRFFAERIDSEERALLSFFGDVYKTYRDKTPTWIPFIR